MCSCRGGGRGGHNLHVSKQRSGHWVWVDGGDKGHHRSPDIPEGTKGMWGSLVSLWGTEVGSGEKERAPASSSLPVQGGVLPLQPVFHETAVNLRMKPHCRAGAGVAGAGSTAHRLRATQQTQPPALCSAVPWPLCPGGTSVTHTVTMDIRAAAVIYSTEKLLRWDGCNVLGMDPARSLCHPHTQSRDRLLSSMSFCHRMPASSWSRTQGNPCTTAVGPCGAGGEVAEGWGRAGAAQTPCSRGMCWSGSQARGCSQLAPAPACAWLSAGPSLLAWPWPS